MTALHSSSVLSSAQHLSDIWVPLKAQKRQDRHWQALAGLCRSNARSYSKAQWSFNTNRGIVQLLYLRKHYRKSVTRKRFVRSAKALCVGDCETLDRCPISSNVLKILNFIKLSAGSTEWVRVGEIFHNRGRDKKIDFRAFFVYKGSYFRKCVHTTVRAVPI